MYIHKKIAEIFYANQFNWKKNGCYILFINASMEGGVAIVLCLVGAWGGRSNGRSVGGMRLERQSCLAQTGAICLMGGHLHCYCCLH